MRIVPTVFVAGLFSMAAAGASAQTVIVEPPMPGEVIIAPEGFVGPPTMEDARLIAMANGVVTVEDVDHRWVDGDFEVEGRDAYGEEIRVVIDAETGAVLDIDS